MKDKSIHLSEDQILLSLVDENDLSEDTKSHFLACPACRRKKATFVLELDRLGEKAKDFTPDLKQKPVLFPRKPRYFFPRIPIFAAGFALVLIIVLALSLVLFTDSSKQMTAQLSTEKEEYLYLLDEILEEPYLSDHYLDITAASNSYFDDEFVEFVVPLEDPLNSV
jgi:hypothetical protein